MTVTVEEEPAFNLTDVDRAVLAQTDEEFTYHGWEELKDIIGIYLPPLPPFPKGIVPRSSDKKLTPAKHEAISVSSSGNPPTWSDIWPGPKKLRPSMAQSSTTSASGG
jgi:hypothetical protein